MTTSQDDSAPATKRDLTFLKQDLTAGLARAKQDLHDAVTLIMGTLEHMATKDDIAKSENHMIALMETWRLDLVGIHKDKISQHEDRITRLEDHAGLIAA